MITSMNVKMNNNLKTLSYKLKLTKKGKGFMPLVGKTPRRWQLEQSL
jgi:hypothetical protein